MPTSESISDTLRTSEELLERLHRSLATVAAQIADTRALILDSHHLMTSIRVASLAADVKKRAAVMLPR